MTDLQGVVSELTALVATWGIRVLGALALLFMGRAVAKWARSVARRGLERAGTDPTLVPFAATIIYYLLLAIVVIAVLGVIGVQTASLIAVLGAAGLAVGLALQGTLSNLAAGVMLLVFRPFQKGDFIEAGGVAGSVVSIGIFTTLLNSPDNVAIVIPNASVWGETIKNYAANPTRRNDLTVGIAYGDDIERAVETIRSVLNADERVLAEPTPVIAVGELGDSSVNLVVRPWCKKEDYWPLRFDLTRRLKEELERSGCSIPFPQRDVHLFRETAA